MQFSGSKKKTVFSDIQVKLNDKHIKRVSVFKYIGLWLDETLSLKEHIGHISKKVNKRLGMISRVRKNVTRDTALMLYKSLVLPHLENCDIVCANNLKNTIQNLQNRACKPSPDNSKHDPSPKY